MQGISPLRSSCVDFSHEKGERPYDKMLSSLFNSGHIFFAEGILFQMTSFDCSFFFSMQFKVLKLDIKSGHFDFYNVQSSYKFTPECFFF